MRGLVLLTALPPTIGHAHLINFAQTWMKNFTGGSDLVVLVCTQPGEPLCEERFYAVQQHCLKYHFVRCVFLHAKMPQYPKDDTDVEFWKTWRKEIERKCGQIDYVFSSEKYGYRLSIVLGAHHIPADINREYLNVRASAVRQDPIKNFKHIMHTFRKYVQKTVTIFGAESTGKTTTAKEVASLFGGGFINEWARPYLESLPSPETNDLRMLDIVRGQYSHQLTAAEESQLPVIIRDTDLLSTIGYYDVYCENGRDLGGYRLARKLFEKSRADLYICMSTDRMPFTPDPLRYGGDHRETSHEFWINLLNEYECGYCTVSALGQDRTEDTFEVSKDLYLNQQIWNYQREVQK